MKVCCLHTLDEILALRTDIDALNLASPRPDPFSTCEFYATILQHGIRLKDNEKIELWFLCAFDDNQLIGYLGLKRLTQTGWMGKQRKLDFLVGHEADRPHVVARSQHLEEVTASFYRYLSARHDWDFLDLQQQDASSVLFPLPRSVHLRRCWIDEYPTWENCTIRLRWNSAQEYYDALSSNLRSALRRQLRKLLAHGKVELLTSMDPRATPALFDLYCSIESRSWKGDTDIAIGSDPTRVRYFKTLLGARQPMQIVIQILLLDGMPIAGLVSGSFSGPSGKGLYGLQVAFDRELSALAPGSFMLLLGMRHAILGGYAFFNLLSGFGYFKSRWLADATNTRSIQIYRIGSLYFWRRLCGNVRRRLRLQRERLSAPQFNPLRRSVNIATYDERHASSGTSPNQVRSQERALCEELVAHARQSECEFLSAPDLRSVLEFVHGMTVSHSAPQKQKPRKICASVAGLASSHATRLTDGMIDTQIDNEGKECGA